VGPSQTHILPLFVPEVPRAAGADSKNDGSTVMAFCEALLDAGVFAQGIRPPTVPPGTSRLRLCAMATHTKSQLDRAIEAFDRVGRRMGILA